MTLKKELLDILACPKCKGHLDYQEDKSRLICQKCRLVFAVKDGIPVMLLEEATPLS